MKGKRVCGCKCVCVHACVCVCVVAWECVRRVCVCVRERAGVWMFDVRGEGFYIHIYIGIYIYVCMYIDIHTCTHTRVYTNVCEREQTYGH